VIGLIYIYTEKKENADWILKNDLYFNLYTSNLPFTESDIEVIASIDAARVTKDNHIETKYGLGTIRNLSSGCKTYLNIVKNPDKVVSVEECGRNVLEMIFTMDEIHIYMNRPERFSMNDEIKMCFNNTEVVKGKSGYEQWWSNEYERRAQIDL
jgi:hypothetical protein